jgi:SAM-dependent methyltransferase
MKIKSKSDVDNLMGAHLPSAALNAALAIGLFWRLAGSPQSSGAIAQATGIPGNRCRYWLKLLASMDLLDQDGDLFSPSPVARAAILETNSEDTWKRLAAEAPAHFEKSLRLLRLLSEPDAEREQPAGQILHLPSYVLAMVDDLEQARSFCQLLFDLHTPLAQDIVDVLEINGARRLLDVGGGSGVVSLALLRRHPQLTAVVADIPNVCTAGREIAARTAEADRISFHAADLVHDPLPTGFDIVIECDLSIFDDPFLAKLAASLNEGGRLVIVDRWFEAEKYDAPARLAHPLRETLRDPNFSLRTLEEIEDGLERAGLVVESVGSIPYGNWTMIQARKGGASKAGASTWDTSRRAP